VVFGQSGLGQRILVGYDGVPVTGNDMVRWWLYLAGDEVRLCKPDPCLLDVQIIFVWI
jgi:hypothetical protein